MATPTPMPAFAPAERPLFEAEADLVVDDGAPGLAEGEDVESWIVVALDPELEAMASPTVVEVSTAPVVGTAEDVDTLVVRLCVTPVAAVDV